MTAIYKEGDKRVNKAEGKGHRVLAVRVSTRLASQLNEKLKKVAKSHKWSVNTLLGDILEKWMEENNG